MDAGFIIKLAAGIEEITPVKRPCRGKLGSLYMITSRQA
jgi:hypothetical protein